MEHHDPSSLSDPPTYFSYYNRGDHNNRNERRENTHNDNNEQQNERIANDSSISNEKTQSSSTYYFPKYKKLTRREAEVQFHQLYISIPNIHNFANKNKFQDALLEYLVRFGTCHESFFLERIVFINDQGDQLCVTLAYVKKFIPYFYKWACRYANEAVTIARKIYKTDKKNANRPWFVGEYTGHMKRYFMRKATNISGTERIASYFALN